MGNVIPIRGDPHDTTQDLLPWYLTGTLDPAAHQLVESHLSQCAQCRADLDAEKRLREELAAMPAPDPATEQWSALRQRAILANTPPPAAGRFRGKVGGLALLAASQIIVLFLGVGAYDWLRERNRADYHGLSASAPVRSGNLIVMFQPGVTEQQFRAALNGIGARLVDGPTAAGAYVLSVPQIRREAVLKALRIRDDVLLAQPLDARAAP